MLEKIRGSTVFPPGDLNVNGKELKRDLNAWRESSVDKNALLRGERYLAVAVKKLRKEKPIRGFIDRTSKSLMVNLATNTFVLLRDLCHFFTFDRKPEMFDLLLIFPFLVVYEKDFSPLTH